VIRSDHTSDHTSLELPTLEESVPLRIFISHTGGPTGHEKNFAINLSTALTSEAKSLRYSYDVFIDREMDKGKYFPDLLFHKIEKTDLGLVIVSKEFFKKEWPMVELMKFMELYEHKPPKVLVLPLFYKLTPKDVRFHLKKGLWEEWWIKMSTEQNHPIDLQKCREVVKTLCSMNGVEYIYRDESHEAEYIADILKAVRKIYDKMQRNPIGEAGPSSSSLP
jgi:hypothetical protein